MTRHEFPDGFVFGSATSAYQIEGHAQGGAGPCHWDSFAATPGNVVRAETGDLACDHLTRWQTDLDLVRDAGFDAYRFSTSWARVMPDGTGTPNPEGLDFYDKLVDGMLERGLKPAATLYHWELPQPLADRGGWANADMPHWFADFAQVIARRLGDRLWSTAPINEPWCVAWLGHFEGVFAPGLRDIRATARAVHHVLLSHGRAMETLRGEGLRNLGAVCNFEAAIAASDTPADRAAADRYDALYNRMFVEPLFQGRYPDAVLEGLAPYLPPGWEDDFATIRAPLDWLGVNYYTCQRIAAAPDTPWPALATAPPQAPLTQMGWEIHPEGLRDFLTRLARDHTGRLPLYVTENGMAHADAPSADGTVDDAPRIAFLADHLAAVRQAAADGAPVRGYFVWSLLDNYEWTSGYDKRFGIVHVDFDTLTRTPKASWHALRAMLAPEASR